MRKKITIESKKKNPVTRNLRELVKRVLEAEGRCQSVNIVLADDETLARLNESFKGKKGTTDVLSFPFNEEDFLGEIYISLDRAKIQAIEYNATEDEEIKRLVVHGLLHLLGYSHRRMPSRLKRYL